MTLATVTLMPVRCYEVFGVDNKSLGLFKAGSDWEGMRALTSLVPLPSPHESQPRPCGTIVIEAPIGLTEMLAGTMMGQQYLTAEVIKCTPLLLPGILGNQQAKEDTHRGQ